MRIIKFGIVCIVACVVISSCSSDSSTTLVGDWVKFPIILEPSEAMQFLLQLEMKHMLA